MVSSSFGVVGALSEHGRAPMAPSSPSPSTHDAYHRAPTACATENQGMTGCRSRRPELLCKSRRGAGAHQERSARHSLERTLFVAPRQIRVRSLRGDAPERSRGVGFGIVALLAGFLNSRSQMGNLVENSNPRNLEGPHPQPLQRRAPLRSAHAIRRILVCIDRSPFSEVCLPYAVAIAKSFGSAITLLHVMQPPHERPGLHATDVLGWEISRQEAERLPGAARAGGTTASGRPVDTRLEQGHPAERIIGRRARARRRSHRARQSWRRRRGGVESRQHGAAGPGGDARLGAHRALRLGARRRTVSPKRILVPLDGSLRTESVLPTAARIANALRRRAAARPRRPGAVADRGAARRQRTWSSRASSPRASRPAPSDTCEGLRDQLAHEGASVRTLVVRQHGREAGPPRALAEGAGAISSCSPRTAPPAIRRRPFGSVTAHLAHALGVPLLVLQDLRDSELRATRSDDERAPPLRAAISAGGRLTRRGRAAAKAEDTAKTTALEAEARALAEDAARHLRRAEPAVARLLDRSPSPIARALERAQKHLASSQFEDADAAEGGRVVSRQLLLDSPRRAAGRRGASARLRSAPARSSRRAREGRAADRRARAGAGRKEQHRARRRRAAGASSTRYQEVSPLTIAELWALPTMLRIVGAARPAPVSRRARRPVTVARARPAAILRTSSRSALDPGAGVERSIRALRLLAEHRLEDVLREDEPRRSHPARRIRRSVYARMDFETCDAYRKVGRGARVGHGRTRSRTSRSSRSRSRASSVAGRAPRPRRLLPRRRRADARSRSGSAIAAGGLERVRRARHAAGRRSRTSRRSRS